MTPLETRYRRLLRWYPASWRRKHGEVLLGTLLDAAEASGRARPTAAEARSLRVTGLGERLTARIAAAAAALALLCAGAAMLLAMLGPHGQAADAARIALGTFCAPLLLSVAAVSIARAARRLTPARALVLVAVAAAAWGLAASADAAWSVGFDEADAGAEPSAFAAAFLPLFLGAWVLGSLAVALLTRALLPMIPRALGWIIGALIGAFVAPALGISFAAPATGLMASGATLVVLMLRASPRPRTATVTPPLRVRARRRYAVVAGAVLAVCVVAFVIAMTGHLWIPGADGTRAVQLGLATGQLAALPLVAAGAMLCARRTGASAPLVWLGASLLATALVGEAVATFAAEGPMSGDLPWGILLPASLGLGIATAGTLPAPPLQRAVVTVAFAVVVFFPAWGLLVGAAVFAAAFGIVLLVWGLQRPRSIRLEAPRSA